MILFLYFQVENEYGSYACDRPYTLWLRDVFLRYVGDNAVLFTTDGNGSGYLRCGPIPGVFITVDFGPMDGKFYYFSSKNDFSFSINYYL
jgi:beta-galactosidase